MARPKRSLRQQLESKRKERERHKRKNRAREKLKPTAERPLSMSGRKLLHVMYAALYRPYVETSRSLLEAARLYAANHYDGPDALREIDTIRKRMKTLRDKGLL